MTTPPISTGTSTTEARLSRFIPRPTRDTLVVVGPSKQGPAFVPEHVEEISNDGDNSPFNTLEGIFGSTNDNIHNHAFQSSINWLQNKRQACYIRTLGFGNTGKRLNITDDINNGIVEGSGFIVGDMLKSGSLTPGQPSKNKYAFYEEGETGVPGRTYFLGSLYKIKDSLDINPQYANKRIINLYDNVPDDKTFAVGVETYTYMPIVNAVLMTAHGVVPTLSLRKDISNDFFSDANFAHAKFQLRPSGEINPIIDHNEFDEENGLYAKGEFSTRSVEDGEVTLTNYYTNSDQGYYFGNYIKDNADDHRAYEIILNGYDYQSASDSFKVTELEGVPHKKVIKFSLDPTNDNYLFGPNIKINKDPTRLQEYGYCFYAMFDVKNNYGSFLEPVTTNENSTETGVLSAFILSGSFGRNEASATNPNWENFQDKYKRAESPWIISQTKNINELDKSDLSSAHELFKVKSLYEGEEGNKIQFNIELENPPEISDSGEKIYATFNLIVYKYNSEINEFIEQKSFKNLNLDVNSDNFIGYKIGTQSSYYDFESNNVITEGLYIQNSKHIFIELSDFVADGLATYDIIPCGFKGIPHLNIPTLNTSYSPTGIFIDTVGIRSYNGLRELIYHPTSEIAEVISENIIVPPLPLLANPKYERVDDFTLEEKIVWGICNNKVERSAIALGEEFAVKNQLDDTFPSTNFNNEVLFLNYNNDINETILDYSKYFFNEYTAAENCVKNNALKQNDFSLERILVQDIRDGDVDKVLWKYSRYIDDGLSLNTLRDNTEERFLNKTEFYRYLNINSDFTEDNKKYLNFKCGLFGGFNGLNIFDRDEYNMTPDGVSREHYLTSENVNTPLHNAFNKGFDIAFSRDDLIIKDIVSTSGVTSPDIQRKWSRETENYKDFLFLRDIPFVDAGSLILTGSVIHREIDEDDETLVNVTQNTKYIDSIYTERGSSFKESYLNIDSSFVADFYGYCEGLHDDNSIVLSPTSIAISSLSKTELSKSPALSTALDDDEIIEFKELFDKKFVVNNENYLNNKELYQKKKINVIKSETVGGTVEFGLADGKTNLDISDSNLKSIGFRRTLLRLRKNIKNAVLREVLFESNDSNRITARKYQLFSDNEVSKFLRAGYISSGEVKIPDTLSQEDIENYVLTAETTISFNSLITKKETVE